MYKVLIVEDDPMVAMINTHYVEQDSRFYVVQSFRNGNDAFKYLSENQVDLAILDVYMPVLDGLSLLKKIRTEEINTDIIMVTASNDKNTLDTVLNFGVIDYLVKPFVQERFQQALDKFVECRVQKNNVCVLDQKKIDEIMNSEHLGNNNFELPKGIQEKTLDKIREYLREDTTSGHTSEQIAAFLDISKVTVRKYMHYLTKNSEVIEQINYDTGGRPCMLFSMNLTIYISDSSLYKTKADIPNNSRKSIQL